MLTDVPKDIVDDLKPEFDPQDFQYVSGGCINNGGKLETNSGAKFLKWNDASRYPGMFKAEALGLSKLFETGTIRIPEVTKVDEVGKHSYILMEFISSAGRKSDFFEQMGRTLAALHQNSHEKFGLDHHNYIGSLDQDNSVMDTWVEFFIVNRLEAQFRYGIDHGRIPASMTTDLKKLFTKLEDLIPEEAPALIHGDLWSGNFITDDQGEPCLIDPAVYYGHREMDLSFSLMFGGFDQDFYSSYDEEFALEPGFRERVPIHNLYPLLVHVNLFGGGYLGQFKSTLRRFT